MLQKDFREALGRQKPKNMAELMKLATEWADGEDVVQSKTPHSPQRHHDRRDSRDHRDSRDRRDRDDKQRRRDYDRGSKDKVKFVAAGFSYDDRNQDDRKQDDRRNNRQDDRRYTRSNNYRRDISVDRHDDRNRDQRGSYRRQDWQSRSDPRIEKSSQEKMEDECRLHMFKDPATDRLTSHHTMGQCRKFEQMATEYMKRMMRDQPPAVPSSYIVPPQTVAALPPPPPHDTNNQMAGAIHHIPHNGDSQYP